MLQTILKNNSEEQKINVGKNKLIGIGKEEKAEEAAKRARLVS